MNKGASVHEPEAALLGADDAVRDAERLDALLRVCREAERPTGAPVSLFDVLGALDHLGPEELRQVARRAEERLAEAHSKAA